MNQTEMIIRVRALTRDLTSTIFREEDIVSFINEGIDRCGQIIPQLSTMTYLAGTSDVPILLPNAYHSLLAIYATGRCFGQDERHYQGSTFMNEFEQKMDELKVNVENSRVVLTNPDGTVVDASLGTDSVRDNYFFERDSNQGAFDQPTDTDLPSVPIVDGGTF